MQNNEGSIIKYKNRKNMNEYNVQADSDHCKYDLEYQDQNNQMGDYGFDQYNQMLSYDSQHGASGNYPAIEHEDSNYKINKNEGATDTVAQIELKNKK